MRDRGGVPVKAVVFTVALCLAVAAIVFQAIQEHGEDHDVHLATVPSESDSAVAGSTGRPTPTPSESIPRPKPQTVAIGPAICGPGDYRLAKHTELEPPTGTPTGRRYSVTATYRGPTDSYCIFIEYPKLTVDGVAGRTRTLNPAGGFVDGYGQPPPTRLSRDSAARTYLLVQDEPTDGKGCNKETPTFTHVELVKVKLPSLSGWCTLAESPWLPVGQEAKDNSTPGPPSCKPYNLRLAQVAAPRNVGNRLVYTFTVKHKPGADCVLDDFPHLAATLATGPTSGSIHQLELTSDPKGPPVPLTDAQPAATTTVTINAGRCAGFHPPLSQLRVENLYYQSHPIDVPKWCSITESYWTAAP